MMEAVDIAASALAAERIRMNVIANNIANANTTRDQFGKLMPFRRRVPVFEQGSGQDGGHERGVHVKSIGFDPAPPRQIYDPSHPDANDAGYRLLPNINVIVEMVDMISATRSYQANVSMVEMTKRMMNSTLSLLR